MGSEANFFLRGLPADLSPVMRPCGNSHSKFEINDRYGKSPVPWKLIEITYPITTRRVLFDSPRCAMTPIPIVSGASITSASACNFELCESCESRGAPEEAKGKGNNVWHQQSALLSSRKSYDSHFFFSKVAPCTRNRDGARSRFPIACISIARQKRRDDR